MQNHFVSASIKQAPTVYLVDNDPEIRRSISALFSAAGIRHQCYERASELLGNIQGHGPACVLAAACMPDLSGVTLINRLRETHRMLPVILMAEQGEVDDVIRAFRAGAVDVFLKPFSGSLLLERVRDAMEHHRAQRARHAQANDLRLRLARLTQRERQVMGLLIEGHANKEIAWQLKLSDKTIAAHRANLLNKMQFDTLAKLIGVVVRHDLDPDAPAQHSDFQPANAA